MAVNTECVTAPDYPSDTCEIALSAIDFGIFEASLEASIIDHGNDRSVTWPSYTQEEEFRAEYLGKGDTLNEGRYWGVWLLKFTSAEKTVRIDVGKQTIERLEGDEFTPGTPIDISDTVAAFYNLDEMKYQSRLSGMQPAFFLGEMTDKIIDAREEFEE